MPSEHGVPDFHHPYKPYKIQEDLILALYDCIEESKVGIFESPTGTGKSLSLICGSLSWLRNHIRADFDGRNIPLSSSDEPDWIAEHAHQQRKRLLLDNRKELESRLEAIRLKEHRIRKQQTEDEPAQKRRKLNAAGQAETPEDDFMLNDYHSDDERNPAISGTANELGLSAETQALMDGLGMSASTRSRSDELDDDDDQIKIYFCSRTHSQLTQFVGELRRVEMPSAYPRTEQENDFPIESFKQLSLSSRKNLCINEKVLKLRNPTAINERCLDLQAGKTPKDEKCPYMPSQENKVQTLDFRHYALAKIRDIEDLAVIGKKLAVCPYYASRSAIKPSEIVTLPYPMLLQASARQALGIKLKDNIVIIDEAHNLMDAILGMYTVEISLAQLQLSREQLATYLQKYRNRLKGRNRVYVTQVVRLIDSLRECLVGSAARLPAGGVLHQNDLLAGKGVDQINLYKLLRYLDESRLARKVQGFVQSQRQEDGDKAENAPPVLTVLGNFIMALTNPAAEGRFFFTAGNRADEQMIKYLLLDPAEHFREIVESARSVILVGGTMSPMDDYIHQLFPYLDSERITTLSCGHVIPSTNLFVGSLATTLNGSSLDFTFSNRTSRPMLLDLGETLIQLLAVAPDGAVIFFPSYAYLEHVLSVWRSRSSPGALTSILDRLEKVKKVFVDSPSAKAEAVQRPKTASGSSSVDDVLAAYTASVLGGSQGGDDSNIEAKTRNGGRAGAVLLSVIGGRLSEGINFSDALGRLVIVIGLPYPNPHAPDFKARMSYIESRAAERAAAAPLTKSRFVKGGASREFADNLCMRAVNQAIGRAVRHKDDWAAILLVDGRYSQPRIVGKLPGWIRGSMDLVDGMGGMNAGSVRERLDGFYKRMTGRQHE